MGTNADHRHQETDRDATVAAIRAALKRRSRTAWSVKGGQGSAWGWIEIDAAPRLRTAHHIKADDAPELPESYGEQNTGEPHGHTPLALREELTQLLGLPRRVGFQGVSIPASSDYRREYIDRAEGRTPSVVGTPYWD